jgi:hypothetical protein
MAVREFSSTDGTRWRVWDIAPEAIHPQTKVEDYLSDCFQIGWLVFETWAGDQKRRLCPYPIGWQDATDDELENLLMQADAVPPLKLARERMSGGRPAPGLPAPDDASLAKASAERPDVTDMSVVRSFRYPGGRLWTVCVIAHPEDGGPPVLRFSAGARHVDMRSWPRDWPDYPDERLVELLRAAAPRFDHGPSDTGAQRRWEERKSGE